MKFGLIYSYQGEKNDGHRIFAESVEQVRLAERLGFDHVLVSEHHLVDNGYFPACLVVAAALAARTERIRVGTGVLLLPLYDPLHVAEHGAVLDVISDGRLILGLGQGYRKEEFDAFGVALKERPSRLEEGTQLIRRLWTESTVQHHGRHFRIESAMLRPQPRQKPHPPIWIAAKQKKAVELAARVGDAWFADPITPLPVIRDRLGDYKRALGSAGKEFAGREFPLMREVYVARSNAAAWEEARASVLYVYKEYLDWGHMQDDDGKPVPPGDARALDLLRQRFMIGDPDFCIDYVKNLEAELGVNALVMRMKFPGLPHDKVMASIKLFADEVMPRFK